MAYQHQMAEFVRSNEMYIADRTYCSISFNSYGHMSHAQKSTKIFVSHSVTRFLYERSSLSHSKFAQIWVKKGVKTKKIRKSHMSQGVIRKVQFVSVVTPQMELRIERNATVVQMNKVKRYDRTEWLYAAGQNRKTQPDKRFRCD
jgi:SOS response regulatory protein OraA/RecX